MLRARIWQSVLVLLVISSVSRTGAENRPRTPKRAESLEQLVLATVWTGERLRTRSWSGVYRRKSQTAKGVRLSELSRDSLESFLRLYIKLPAEGARCALARLGAGLRPFRAELEQKPAQSFAESFLFDKKSWSSPPSKSCCARPAMGAESFAIMLFFARLRAGTPAKAYQRALRALELLRQGVPL
jgi:hypothetical protein